ncbi:interleukin-25 [Pelodiscus sinensis]|uniref:interleukin-25 n=1 Tax=Pelodiscus sinensis TaxID=13735 RepID=UPI003F6BC12C
MAGTLWAGLLLLLWAGGPGGAERCVGPAHCCDEPELDKAGAWLSVGHPQEAQHWPYTPQEIQCKGQAHGPLHARSIAPWRYREDRDKSRFPRRLLQAECVCPHCVSLAPPHPPDRRGNSVPLNTSTWVYYRRPCPARPGAFFLEPRRYPLAVACVCVLPRA